MNTQKAPPEVARRSTTGRQNWNMAFLVVCVASAVLSMVILVLLLGSVFQQGTSSLNKDFIFNANSTDAHNAGIFPALIGSMYVCFGCALFSLPIGVATAIYLEEYRPRNKWIRLFRSFIQLNIANLAGVPSVVYGILGLTAFVNMFGVFGNPLDPSMEIGITNYIQYPTLNPKRFVRIPIADRSTKQVELKTGLAAFTAAGEAIELTVVPKNTPRPKDMQAAGSMVRENAKGSQIAVRHWYYLRLPFGVSVLSGSLTLMLVILPMVIISSQEALRAVPESLREGALGMGATPWQTVWNITLPAAVPGIMTGAILSMSRAIGEAAPVLIISGIVFIQSPPSNLLDKFSVMPLQIYNWAQQPSNQGFHGLAAGGIIVLLAMLLMFNGLAVFIRHRLQKPLS